MVNTFMFLPSWVICEYQSDTVDDQTINIVYDLSIIQFELISEQLMNDSLQNLGVHKHMLNLQSVLLILPTEVYADHLEVQSDLPKDRQ